MYPLTLTRSDHPFTCSLRPLLAALCAMACASSVSTAAEIPGYAVLPLVPMGRHNQAMLRFTVNGQRTMFALDTGAGVTVLDEGFYRGTHPNTPTITKKDLPAELGEKLNANGQRAAIGTVETLEAGGHDFGKRQVLLTDLTRQFTQYNYYHSGTTVSGLLGEDFLRQHAAIIDWARRGVYLNTDPRRRLKFGSEFTAAGWTGVKMARTSGGLFSVQATVSGKPVRLLVDTGAQFTTFAADVVPLNIVYNNDRRGTMNRINASTLTMSMIGGDMNSHPARVENWKIGTYIVQSSNVVVSKLPSRLQEEKSTGEGPMLGLLGAEVLAANNAIVDVGGETLYLKRK